MKCVYTKKGPSSKLRHIKLFISNFDTLHVEHTILVLQKGQESDNGVVCIHKDFGLEVNNDKIKLFLLRT